MDRRTDRQTEAKPIIPSGETGRGLITLGQHYTDYEIYMYIMYNKHTYMSYKVTETTTNTPYLSGSSLGQDLGTVMLGLAETKSIILLIR